MLAKYFSIIRNDVLSVSSQRKYSFYHQRMLLDAFQTNYRNINQCDGPVVLTIEEWLECFSWTSLKLLIVYLMNFYLQSLGHTALEIIV